LRTRKPVILSEAPREGREVEGSPENAGNANQFSRTSNAPEIPNSEFRIFPGPSGN